MKKCHETNTNNNKAQDKRTMITKLNETQREWGRGWEGKRA